MRVSSAFNKSIFATLCRVLLGGTVLLITIGAGGCPFRGSGGQGGEVTPEVGIAFADASGSYADEQSHVLGDVVTIPVAVMPVTGEREGQVVAVTIDRYGEDDIAFTPTVQNVPLPAPGGKTFITFQARMNKVIGAYSGFRARRYSTETSTNPHTTLQAESGCYIVAGLIDATFIPNTAQIPRGASQSLTVQLHPRGTVSGTKTIDLSTASPSVPVVPARFDVAFTAGSTTPIEKTVFVRPAGNAGLGQYDVLVREFNGVSYGKSMGIWRFRVIDGAGSPEFTFTANKTAFTVPNGEPTENIVFTLRSVNQFDGDISVSHASDDETLVEPNINPYTVHLSPGTPVTWSRRMYRFFGTAPVVIKFRAHADGFTVKEIVTTLTLP